MENVSLFFLLSPENHLRDTISTGHTGSCHTLTYVPTFHVAAGPAHPQLLGSPLQADEVCGVQPRAPSGPKVQFPFLSTGQGEHSLCTPLRTALVGT